MSELEIFLWVHSGWVTECRVTAILWTPPILWIPFRLDLKWISRIFQLYLSDFHFPHFRAPPICDFGFAHWKKQNICRVFPLYLSDFNVCIFKLFIHYTVRTSHVDTPDNSHDRHDRRWCTFFKPAYLFPQRTRNGLLLGKFIQRIKTFFCDENRCTLHHPKF